MQHATIPKIKICGVRSTEEALQIAKQGAHFIGLIFHPTSKRCVTVQQAQAITEGLKPLNTEPVAVFVDQNAEEMADICRTTHIKTIQLHGTQPRQHHHLLPASYQRLYVRPVTPAGVIVDDDGGLMHCLAHRDIVLFDNERPGKGVPFDWDVFRYTGLLPWGLAGGLTPDNVAMAIAKLQPSLVDVSGGVEIEPGVKDLQQVQQFIHSCQQGVNHAQN